jgi:transcriptional antiterminator RfaH
MGYWAVARLEQRREALGIDSLRRGGFEPYYPRLREHRVRSGRKIVVTPPLFAGYVFIVVRLQWHEARWAPGVLSLIKGGDGRPARVPDVVITDLRSRERNGLIELPQPALFKPGDSVRITAGAFAGLSGLVAGMKPRERVELLLATLGRVTLSVGGVELVTGS